MQLAHAEVSSGPASTIGDAIGSLVRSVAPIPSDTPVQRVADRFADDAELGALPVVDDRRPTGLVTRTKLSRRLFARFGMAIYERRPISVLLEVAPLVVRSSDSIVDVLERAIRRPADDVYDEVIVVDSNGSYVGLVEMKRLVLEQGHVLARTAAERELADERAKELEALSKMKTQFLAHVTHELRAPVNTLVGLAELVDTAEVANDPARLRKYLAMIAKSSASLRQLVNNVLDLSKIESGRMRPQPGPFDVRDIVDEVTESLRVLARGKPIEIRVEIARSLPLVSDPVMLRHVLTNLGTNAVKFTDRGHVTFRASETPLGVSVEVIDTGIGMQPQDIERVFEPFAQAADVATRRHEGTGLGLTITKHLIGLLGGSIHVQSTPGAGSCFLVTVPSIGKKETSS